MTAKCDVNFDLFDLFKADCPVTNTTEHHRRDSLKVLARCCDQTVEWDDYDFDLHLCTRCIDRDTRQ